MTQIYNLLLSSGLTTDHASFFTGCIAVVIVLGFSKLLLALLKQ